MTKATLIFLALVLLSASDPAGSAPAARAGDALSDGTILQPGTPTVLICGKPAARVGDPVIETRPGPLGAVALPSTIVVGSTTVLIAGKAAARVGDRTSSGGIIAAGCPTVVIGP
jgi:uncharacterized Zn-binding protein involved in type VI secretion